MIGYEAKKRKVPKKIDNPDLLYKNRFFYANANESAICYAIVYGRAEREKD